MFYRYVIIAAVAMILGCSAPATEGPDAGTTTSTTSTADECGGTCVAPQICGLGCGTTPGCYTPGGTMTPWPNDCPTCFFDPNGGECTVQGYPVAYLCQPGAAPLGGCIAGKSTGVECCPVDCSKANAGTPCVLGAIAGGDIGVCAPPYAGAPLTCCPKTGPCVWEADAGG